MYGGKPELDNENIREMLTSARIFGIEDLEQVCYSACLSPHSVALTLVQLCVAYIDHMLHKVENILVFVELFAKFEDIKGAFSGSEFVSE